MPADQLTETALRLANGSEVRLVDLSRGGARLETDRRMLPNSTIAVKLVTGGESFVITGVVVRSRVIRLSQGGLGYDVAIAFNDAVPRQSGLPDSSVPPPQSAECDTPPADDQSAKESMIHVTAQVSQSAREIAHLFNEGAW